MVHISPSVFPISGFFGFLLPFLLLFQLFFFIFWILKGKLLFSSLSILTLVICFPLIKSGIAFNVKKEAADNDVTLKVLSSNVRVFNVYQYLSKKNPNSELTIQWYSNSDADILALMEFYNHTNDKKYSSIETISKNFPHYYLKTSVVNRVKAEFGQIIFSKHKIVNKGFIKLGNSKFNQAIYIDIIKNGEKVRVYNVHLQSMSIEEHKLFDEKYDENNLKNKFKYSYRKLFSGFKARSEQIDKIVEHIKLCKHKVIVCADLNDIPYSYTYIQLKNILLNSFEEAGWGIGATYNGKIPFLRIDNQFYDSEIEVLDFNVITQQKNSDHFPITATYKLN